MAAGAQKIEIGQGARVADRRWPDGAGLGRGGRAAHCSARGAQARPLQPAAELRRRRSSRSLRPRSASAGWCSRCGPAVPGDTYEIVAGERRWRAAQLANLHEVPVVVRALSDQEAIEIAIIENVQREDLNAIEEGEGYRLLMDGHGYTQEDLAKVIGKSRSHLANTLRLLKLPDGVQDLVRSGELSAGHARALIGRPDAAALAARIVKEGLTVRQVEALTQERASAKPTAAEEQGRRHARRRVGAARGARPRCRDQEGQGREGRTAHPLFEPRAARRRPFPVAAPKPSAR